MTTFEIEQLMLLAEKLEAGKVVLARCTYRDEATGRETVFDEFVDSRAVKGGAGIDLPRSH